MAVHSGYTARADSSHSVFDGDAHFLAKPFSRDSLAREVRQMLDEMA